MTREKFEFTDPNAGGSETNLTMASGGRKNGGCYVSGVVGVALTLVAILIAVGVGLIVHLAEGERELVCQCGSGDGHTGAASADAIKQQCEQWAGQGDQDICKYITCRVL
ncbi:uncharacterized protein LOC101854230 [Aplysia californica]|uniref:Uncharacterized protein LOC101854230 n=1 Tax=Aplysia californica TaxID=6500 RepID=A0ABM0KB00_APLCA|nr:uncharacterized protein LOC101854230 [Aplysia californica]